MRYYSAPTRYFRRSFQIDPRRRTMQQVVIEDAIAADRMFTILIWWRRPEPVRAVIEIHAREVTKPDVGCRVVERPDRLLWGCANLLTARGSKDGTDVSSYDRGCVDMAYTDKLETQTDVDELVESLTGSLEDGDWNVRSGVIRKLGEIGDVKAIEPLIKALGAQNKNVRQRAVKALVKIGESAIDPLIKALGDEDEDRRRRAVEALGKIGDPRAIDPLINVLGDEDRWVRWWAAGMLGTIDDTRVIAPLIKVLEDEDGRVQKRAVEALVSIGGHAVEPLMNMLADADSTAATILGEIGEPAVTSLVNALGADDSWVRCGAVGVLGKIGDPRAVEPLIKALDDDDTYVRWYAADSLGEIGDLRAVEPLIDALGDYESDVRWGAAGALGKIGNVRAVEPLINALGDGEEGVRAGIVTALGEIGDTRAVEPLIKALDDDDEYVRWYAAEALGEIGDLRAVEPLIKALRTVGMCDDVATALVEIGDSSAVEPLIDVLDDKDDEVRWYAISNSRSVVHPHP